MYKKIINPKTTQKKLLNNHLNQLTIMNDPKNLYSIYWPNKILEKKYKLY